MVGHSNKLGFQLEVWGIMIISVGEGLKYLNYCIQLLGYAVGIWGISPLPLFICQFCMLFCFSMTGYGSRAFVNSQLFLTLDNSLHYFLFFVVLFLLKGWERSKPTTPCCKDINKFPNEEWRFSSGGNSYKFIALFLIFSVVCKNYNQVVT